RLLAALLTAAAGGRVLPHGVEGEVVGVEVVDGVEVALVPDLFEEATDKLLVGFGHVPMVSSRLGARYRSSRRVNIRDLTADGALAQLRSQILLELQNLGRQRAAAELLQARVSRLAFSVPFVGEAARCDV